MHETLFSAIYVSPSPPLSETNPLYPPTPCKKSLRSTSQSRMKELQSRYQTNNTSIRACIPSIHPSIHPHPPSSTPSVLPTNAYLWHGTAQPIQPHTALRLISIPISPPSYLHIDSVRLSPQNQSFTIELGILWRWLKKRVTTLHCTALRLISIPISPSSFIHIDPVRLSPQNQSFMYCTKSVSSGSGSGSECVWGRGGEGRGGLRYGGREGEGWYVARLR